MAFWRKETRWSIRLWEGSVWVCVCSHLKSGRSLSVIMPLVGILFWGKQSHTWQQIEIPQISCCRSSLAGLIRTTSLDLLLSFSWEWIIIFASSRLFHVLLLFVVKFILIPLALPCVPIVFHCCWRPFKIWQKATDYRFQRNYHSGRPISPTLIEATLLHFESHIAQSVDNHGFGNWFQISAPGANTIDSCYYVKIL